MAMMIECENKMKEKRNGWEIEGFEVCPVACYLSIRTCFPARKADARIVFKYTQMLIIGLEIVLEK
jgi:hypothetical protein